MVRYWHPDQVAGNFFQEISVCIILQRVLKGISAHESDFIKEIGLPRHVS